MSRQHNRIASFDVFDTVLTRSVGEPASLFLLLGKRLAAQDWIQCSPAEFAKLRVEAEARARAKSGQMEVTLSIIYGELCSAMGMKYSAAPLLMEAEREIEAEMSRIVPGGAELIAQARRSQKKIIYVSDFYMPGSFVGRLLEKNGLLADGERCYVSADLGTTKASGELYADVIRTEAVQPWRITHCGNHPKSDVSIAKRRGLRVEPFLAANLNRYETRLENHAKATGGLSSLLAGASRLARLSVPADQPREIALREVAAGVAAPTLTAYVLWLLRRAQAAKLQRLYFISRDGQILHEIARRLAPKMRADIELRYLYGSRQAWHLPGVTKLDARQIEWVMDKTDRLTVGDVLSRVGLTAADVKPELKRADLHRRTRITDDARRQTVREMLQNSIVTALIAERAAALRIPLLAYLKQERMFDGAKWAMVDVGWHGRLQSSLARVLASVDGPTPRGFYFGLHAKNADRAAGKRDAYLFDARSRAGKALLKGYADDLELVPMMEMFCAADHGSVIGFEQVGPKVNALMREPANTRAINWGLPLVQATIRSFAENLTLDNSLVDLDADVRPAVVDVLRAFWLTPTTSEAVAWGAYPYEDDQSGKSASRLAQGYVATDAVGAFYRGRVQRHHRASWIHGSLALTDPITRVLMTFAAAVGSHCRGLVRRCRKQHTNSSSEKAPARSTSSTSPTSPSTSQAAT